MANCYCVSVTIIRLKWENWTRILFSIFFCWTIFRHFHFVGFGLYFPLSLYDLLGYALPQNRRQKVNIYRNLSFFTLFQKSKPFISGCLFAKNTVLTLKYFYLWKIFKVIFIVFKFIRIQLMRKWKIVSNKFIPHI